MRRSECTHKVTAKNYCLFLKSLLIYIPTVAHLYRMKFLRLTLGDFCLVELKAIC